MDINSINSMNIDGWTFLASKIIADMDIKEKIGECGKTKSQCTVRPKLICLYNGGECPAEE